MGGDIETQQRLGNNAANEAVAFIEGETLMHRHDQREIYSAWPLWDSTAAA